MLHAEQKMKKKKGISQRLRSLAIKLAEIILAGLKFFYLKSVHAMFVAGLVERTINGNLDVVVVVVLWIILISGQFLLTGLQYFVQKVKNPENSDVKKGVPPNLHVESDPFINKSYVRAFEIEISKGCPILRCDYEYCNPVGRHFAYKEVIGNNARFVNYSGTSYSRLCVRCRHDAMSNSPFGPGPPSRNGFGGCGSIGSFQQKGDVKVLYLKYTHLGHKCRNVLSASDPVGNPGHARLINELVRQSSTYENRDWRTYLEDLWRCAVRKDLEMTAESTGSGSVFRTSRQAPAVKVVIDRLGWY